ncbi:MAG: hypothetical protein ABIG95_01460 [Candidatus Woesearchaeota archaeon]
MKVDLPEGVGRKLGWLTLRSGFQRIYDELRGAEGSFSKDITTRVMGTKASDADLGIGGITLEEIARQNGLEEEFGQYIRSDIIGGIRGRTAYALDLVTSMKDSLEDAVELAEVGGSAASAVTGAGPIVIQIGGNTFEVPLYVAVQTVYTTLATLLGYVSGTYTLTAKGTVNYISDTIKGMGVIGNAIPLLGSIFEFGTNLDDKRDRIAEASAQRASVWLINKIREKKGLPVLEQPRDLVGIIGTLGSKLRRNGSLSDYEDKQIYGSDISASPYQRI